MAAGGLLNLNPRAMGANEKVTLALIGGRNQGRGVALRAIEQGAEFKTFCDLDPAILEKTGADIAKAQNRKPQFEKDFRRVLDDKEIDAVVIAVPDHWHARAMILACQAGKDVYVEKPLSQTIHEGPADARRRAQVQPRGAGGHAAAQRRALQQRGGVRGRGQDRQGLRDQGVDLPGAAFDRASRRTARRRAAWITTCGSDPAPKRPFNREPVPLQLALLLGLRQHRARQPGRARA